VNVASTRSGRAVGWGLAVTAGTEVMKVMGVMRRWT
jgi:hypothetical protein